MVSKRLCVHSYFVSPASFTFSRSHWLHPRGSSFPSPSFLLCPLNNGDCPLWLSWPPGWFPPNPPLPSSRGILGTCHSQLALSCLKPLGGLPAAFIREAHTSSRISLSSSMSPQPSAHKSHQSQHCPSDGHSPSSVFSHASPVFKAFLFLRIKPDSTPIPTGLWNSITFFPGHCCLAYLQGYGFHGAAITKGHEPGQGADLQQWKCILSLFWREKFEIRCGQTWFPPEALRENLSQANMPACGRVTSIPPCGFSFVSVFSSVNSVIGLRVCLHLE